MQKTHKPDQPVDPSSKGKPPRGTAKKQAGERVKRAEAMFAAAQVDLDKLYGNPEED